MSLGKAIKSGKEHRAPYRRAKAMSASCRNGRSCSYCRDNRRHSTRRRELIAGSPQVLTHIGVEDLMTSDDGEMDQFELELNPEEQQQRAMHGRGEWANWN